MLRVKKIKLKKLYEESLSEWENERCKSGLNI